MKSLLLLLPLLFACGEHSESSDAPNNGGGDPPSVHTDCTDWEDFDTGLGDPQFMGHFESPDRYFVCGEYDGESDYYWFVHDEEFNLNFDLVASDEAESQLTVWTLNSTFEKGEQVLEYDLIYEFFSDNGVLQGNSWPVPYTNHGFILRVSAFSPAEYQLETWPF